MPNRYQNYDLENELFYEKVRNIVTTQILHLWAKALSLT